MNPPRARLALASLPVAAWLALAAPAASGIEVMAGNVIQAVPPVLPTPLAAVGSAWTTPALLPGPGLAAPAPMPQNMLQAVTIPAPPPAAASPVVRPEARPLRAAPGVLGNYDSPLSGLAGPLQDDAAPDAEGLRTLFDGQKRTGADADERASAQSAASPGQASAFRKSRPDYQPHDSVPLALLPDGRAIPPDSFKGGYHGTDIGPDEVKQKGGLPARGPMEDWRLREHAEATSMPVSAFRGSTPDPTSPDGQTGAAYWAGEEGWIYDVFGVPTWDVNSNLEGRIKRDDGIYRGNLMSEDESAFPAQTPLECIRRWGRVSESLSGKLYVNPGEWVANPRYDPAACRRFWGRSAP
jgi:hypothetical protein